MDGENAVNAGHGLVMNGLDRVAIGVVLVVLCDGIADACRPSAQNRRQVAVHMPRIRTRLRFGHCVLRNNTIFVDQSDKHIPLATVVNGCLQKMLNSPILDRAIG